MEQTSYWMWARSKLSDHQKTSHVHATTATYNESWEEQAFAEDSAGLLGGCVWPPRSYSCSFCRREFRSAQALGGHMNVHRRDRARLKQSSSPTSPNENETSSTLHHHPTHDLNDIQPSLLGIHENPSQLCTFVYNKGDVTNSKPSFLSSSSTQDICMKQPPNTYSSSNIVHHETQKRQLLSNSRSNSISARLLILTDSESDKEKEVKYSNNGSISGTEDYVKPNSALTLNFVMPKRSQTVGSSFDIDGEESIGTTRKRRRIIDEPSSYLPFFLKPIPCLESKLEVLKESCDQEEELDLELRLGDHQPNKVKYNCRNHMLN